MFKLFLVTAFHVNYFWKEYSETINGAGGRL